MVALNFIAINSRKEWLSVGHTRKLFNTIGQVGPAVALVGLSFISCDPNTAIVCVCIAQCFDAATSAGFKVTDTNIFVTSKNWTNNILLMC